MRILVVEDDAVIASELAYALERDSHRVDVARDAQTGLDFALREMYDMILLDVMLPGIDGWEVCRQLHQNRIPTPILMLTARDSVDDRVKGFETGADDYLPKPFDYRELRARIQALARRTHVNRSRHLKVADLEIDLDQRRVTRAGQPADLTRREYDLLVALVQNEGRVLTRAVILDSVWHESEAQEGSVNFHMVALRRKVDAAPHPRLIHSIYGLGYSLRRPDSA